MITIFVTCHFNALVGHLFFNLPFNGRSSAQVVGTLAAAVRDRVHLGLLVPHAVAVGADDHDALTAQCRLSPKSPGFFSNKW